MHWEALKDPELPQALALMAPMVRKNLTPQTVPAILRPSPTINLLIVTARPQVERAVGYRTISRPLVEGLRQANQRLSHHTPFALAQRWMTWRCDTMSR